MEYLVVKWLHVLSSTVLFGTGLGSAFYMFSTNRSADVRAIAIVARRVVVADWLFTTPTAIIQPLTGFWLLHKRLERGTFAWPVPTESATAQVELSSSDLAALLGGLDLGAARRRRWYSRMADWARPRAIGDRTPCESFGAPRVINSEGTAGLG